MPRGAKVLLKEADGRAVAVNTDGKGVTPSGPAPVNLGDMAGLKRGMDDCVVAVSASMILFCPVVHLVLMFV